MDNGQLASCLELAKTIEALARQAWETTTDLPERDAALVAKRHATAVRKALEHWIADRALRAHLAAQRET